MRIDRSVYVRTTQTEGTLSVCVYVRVLARIRICLVARTVRKVNNPTLIFISFVCYRQCAHSFRPVLPPAVQSCFAVLASSAHFVAELFFTCPRECWPVPSVCLCVCVHDCLYNVYVIIVVISRLMSQKKNHRTSPNAHICTKGRLAKHECFNDNSHNVVCAGWQ